MDAGQFGERPAQCCTSHHSRRREPNPLPTRHRSPVFNPTARTYLPLIFALIKVSNGLEWELSGIFQLGLYTVRSHCQMVAFNELVLQEGTALQNDLVCIVM